MYDFVVVGGGPAGIISMSYLLAYFPKASLKTLWVDRAFQVGDFGMKWSTVPSNTKVKGFIHFLRKCYGYDPIYFENSFKLFKIELEQTCLLKYVVHALRWITQKIRTQVDSYETVVTSLSYHNSIWKISFLTKPCVYSKNVILAQGADPSDIPDSLLPDIPLDIALNSNKLKIYCSDQDTIAVFGSSHSAILAIRNLIENNNYSQIINFYRSPLRFAEYLPTGEILFDNTGLKGEVAEFARKKLPFMDKEKFLRIPVTSSNIKQHLACCTKIIKATGFKTRKIQVHGYDNITPNPLTGKLGPGLFGCGIAYPSYVLNHLGEQEKDVGLVKFVKHLEKNFTNWVQ